MDYNYNPILPGCGCCQQFLLYLIPIVLLFPPPSSHLAIPTRQERWGTIVHDPTWHTVSR